MPVRDGRALYDRIHHKRIEREKAPAPRADDKPSVARGRALYDNGGSFAAYDD